MVKNFIIADWVNFKQFGGLEKNGKILTKDIAKEKYGLIVLRNRYEYLLILKKIILKEIKVKAFLCFKNSAFIGLIMNLFGVKLIIRVNNSPESYLYWLKPVSLISLILKNFIVKRNIVIFNSKRIKNYYQTTLKSEDNFIYIPNKIKFTNIKIHTSNKLFIASRLSWEKNFFYTKKKFEKLDFNHNYKFKCYSSSKRRTNDLLDYKDLEINFNDIYVSFSYFEGMPNMAIESLVKGAALILSNCWAHVELKMDLEKFNLGKRVFICDIEDQEINIIVNDFISNIKKHNFEKTKQDLYSYNNHLKLTYQKQLEILSKRLES